MLSVYLKLSEFDVASLDSIFKINDFLYLLSINLIPGSNESYYSMQCSDSFKNTYLYKSIFNKICQETKYIRHVLVSARRDEYNILEMVAEVKAIMLYLLAENIHYSVSSMKPAQA